jgi:hypothetical protein
MVFTLHYFSENKPDHKIILLAHFSDYSILDHESLGALPVVSSSSVVCGRKTSTKNKLKLITVGARRSVYLSICLSIYLSVLLTYPAPCVSRIKTWITITMSMVPIHSTQCVWSKRGPTFIQLSVDVGKGRKYKVMVQNLKATPFRA